MQPNSEYLLIETIRQVGVSNYSLIARLTGLNPETVRYKINKQLAKLGLEITISIDYSKLGFQTGLLWVKPNATAGRTWLDHASYLTFVSKAITQDRYLCMYAVPNRFKKKYADSMMDLKNLHLIEEFEFKPASWVRFPPLRTEFYDMETGIWKVDWKRVDSVQNEIGVTSKVVDTDAKIDYIDTKILRLMQEEPTISPAKIARIINANPRTVRFHYTEHVVKGGMILCNNVRWSKSQVQGGAPQTMQVAVLFSGMPGEQTSQARRLCNKMPFTVMEASLEDSGYFAFFDIPMEYFHETVNYLERSVSGSSNDHQTIILDSARTQFQYFPDELYDSERGWRLLQTYQQKISNSSDA